VCTTRRGPFCGPARMPQPTPERPRHGRGLLTRAAARPGRRIKIRTVCFPTVAGIKLSRFVLAHTPPATIRSRASPAQRSRRRACLRPCELALLSSHRDRFQLHRDSSRSAKNTARAVVHCDGSPNLRTAPSPRGARTNWGGPVEVRGSRVPRPSASGPYRSERQPACRCRPLPSLKLLRRAADLANRTIRCRRLRTGVCQSADDRASFVLQHLRPTCPRGVPGACEFRLIR
jgi:hypothetical protein